MATAVAEKYVRLSSTMNEKLKRRWAACEAMSMGRGGVSAVARSTGISRTTIRKGVHEIEQEYPGLAAELGGRIRRSGGGRRSLVESDRNLQSDLKKLVEPATRGEPTSPLLWPSKSTRKLARELQKLGHDVSYRTVARMLHHLEYRRQANRKTREGKQPPDRDAPFERGPSACCAEPTSQISHL